MDLDSAVAKLQVQQEAISGDLTEMKKALTSIADSLKSLSAIEQRQLHLHETTSRAHTRLDDMEKDVKEALAEINKTIKDEIKGHEKRIQALEIAIAKNQWIERAVTAVVMAVIVVWAKGGL